MVHGGANGNRYTEPIGAIVGFVGTLSQPMAHFKWKRSIPKEDIFFLRVGKWAI